MPHILIIEDDPAISLGLEAVLRDDGYRVTTCDNGLDGFRSAMDEHVDLLVLDLMLPGKRGQDICRDLRAAGRTLPILMLTSRNEEVDTVVGLEIGADDYVTKPFSVRELLARITALLRRSTGYAAAIEELVFADVVVNFRRNEAVKAGVPQKLSVRQLQLLKYLAEREGEVLTRDDILDAVWGRDSYPTTRTVDNYILTLRKCLEDDPSHPVHILTVHTAGYRFLREGAVEQAPQFHA